ncbi:MAG: LssY C-terminal domain-containing protein, partial [Deltaproteobacteria bacterium]|nr:LssY C-terminal domain-containing protein [Deltaproteobacteria bacterium]
MSMLRRIRFLCRAVAFGAAWLALGCAGFKPQPMDQIAFRERTQSREREGLRVTVSVPDRDEARRIFGVDLAKKHIQPVWLEIENRSEIPYVFMRTALDPAYFSSHEAAYRFHFVFRPVTNAKMNEHFDDQDIEPFVPPLGKTSGFIFSNLKLGTKEVRVALYGPRRVHIFEFYVAVPGFRADWHEVDWEAIRAQGEVHYDSEPEFRAALNALPCCTTRQTGSGQGDPLNLVLIGSREEVANSLIRAGWDETEVLSFASGWRTFKAFFGGTYKYSPMSALYVDGRPQDAGFQKARDTIHERNHLRLWLSPMRFRGKEVWVGTITR